MTKETVSIRLLALSFLFSANAAFGQFSPGPNPITGTVSTKQTLASGTGTVNGTLSVGSGNIAITVTGTSTLVNNGTIAQTGTVANSTAARGIDLNTANVTFSLTNNNGATIQTTDADVFRANKATDSVTLYNSGTIASQNVSAGGSQAINWSAITNKGSNTLYNYSTGLITASAADAVRPGVNGTIYNDGTIKSTALAGSSSDGIDAQTNSGVTLVNANSAGSGTGTGLIEGGRHGITGGDITGGVFTLSVTNNLGGTIQGDNGSGINIDGINKNEVVTVINKGTITGNGHDIGDGAGHDGDGVDVDGLVNITNSGTIKSLNSFGVGSSLETSEGVTVGGGTIVNTGTIEGDVVAGNATAVGRGITLAGVDKDSSGNAIPIQGIYGNSSITNSGLIKGQTDSGIAVFGPATGFTVTIDNKAGGIIEGAGATAATIQTGADNDIVNNAGSIINDGGDSKTALSLGAGNDQLNVTGGSAHIVGGIDGGSGSNTLTFSLGATANTFTHAGVIANFAQVSVLSGQVSLNGNNIYIGATTVGDGFANASLRVNGRHSGGGAYTVLSGSTLGGTGTFALADAATKIDIQKGASLHIGGGRLTVETGSLNIAGLLNFDLNGTQVGVAGGYDQLTFSIGNAGALTLTGTSALLLNLGFTPVVGQQFELIDLQNSSAHIDGTFAGLAEGSIFNVGSEQFQISYNGGTGNDLVVTAIPEPATTCLLVGVGALAITLVLRRRRMCTIY